jgi:hypothetical protein
MTLFCQFPGAFMVIALSNEKGVPEEYHGYILAVPAVFYIFSSFLCGSIIDYLPKRTFMLLGFVV